MMNLGGVAAFGAALLLFTQACAPATPTNDDADEHARSVARMLQDPDKAADGVGELLAALNIHVYDENGQPVSSDAPQERPDFFIYDSELPALERMALGAPEPFGEYADRLIMSGVDQSREDILRQARDGFARHPDAFLVRLLGHLGFSQQGEVELPRLGQWLLFVDRFVPPDSAWRSGGAARVAVGRAPKGVALQGSRLKAGGHGASLVSAANEPGDEPEPEWGYGSGGPGLPADVEPSEVAHAAVVSVWFTSSVTPPLSAAKMGQGGLGDQVTLTASLLDIYPQVSTGVGPCDLMLDGSALFQQPVFVWNSVYSPIELGALMTTSGGVYVGQPMSVDPPGSGRASIVFQAGQDPGSPDEPELLGTAVVRANQTVEHSLLLAGLYANCGQYEASYVAWTAPIPAVIKVSYHGGEPTPRPATPKPVTPCQDPCGRSHGDPHLTTIDGHEYSFQAAGEFSLLRSADGRFELQARQVPYQDSRSVTINVAVAVGYDGTRVVGKAEGESIAIFVDGQRTTVGGATAAGQLRIAPIAAGYSIAAPDGTIVWLLAMAAERGINLIVSPSDGLRASARGLLGPVADAPAEPRLPALPDGSFVDTGVDYRSALYGQFADGWAVNETTSLFDYASGEGPATFRDPLIPLPEAPLDFRELTAGQQQAGLAVCASISNESLRQQCAFDVIVTGDEGYLEGYQETERLLAQLGGDACALLTGAEIEAVTGFPVLEAEPQVTELSVGCMWLLDSGPDYTDPFELILDVYPVAGATELEKYTTFCFGAQPIDGLGERALEGCFDDVLALTGDTLVHVSIKALIVRGEELAELVRIVVGRL
jgi:hypothetical protein